MRIWRVLVWFTCCWPLVATAETDIIVSRSERQLIVLEKGVEIKRFHVAFGSGGRFGKIHEGDRKTPYGQYEVMAVKKSDRFHGFIQLNYPNIDDAEQGLQTGLITLQQYHAIREAHFAGILPPQHTPLGGAIGVHGIGKETTEKIDIHQHFDWTKGCLALRNKEWDELKALISEGTSVLISP